MNFSKLNIFRYNKLEIKDITSESRNKNIFKQIATFGVFKIIGIGLNFVVVPFMLAALGKEPFGIWVTILSITSWILIMDVGVGTGLRNKLAESLAIGDKIKAKIYISTAYCSLAVIMGVILILFTSVSFFLDWQAIFNTKDLSSNYIRNTILIVVISIGLNFILSLVNQIINALQRSSLTSISAIFANVLLLLALVVFSKQIHNNMQIVAIIYSATILIASIVTSVLLFVEYPYLMPGYQFFQKDCIKDILNTGVKFFVIQIAGVVMFTTDSFIITQELGPSEVTAYNITLKVFTAITMFFGLITTPFWSAYTEAYMKGEIEWIKGRIKLQNQIFVLVILGTIILVFFFNFFIKLWIKTKLDIPNYLPLLAGIYAILSVWCNIYGFVLGGINKIRLGAYLTCFVGLINIPLSIYLVKHTSFGSGGVILGTIVSLLFTAIISPLQVYYFIYTKNKSRFFDNLLS